MPAKQNSRSPVLLFLAITLATLLGTACGGVPSEQLAAPPAEPVSYALPQGARIAIFPFEEHYNKQWRGALGTGIAATKLTRAMSRKKVAGQPFFNVLGRKKLNRLLGRRETGNLNDIQLANAAQVGRLIGFDHVASGQVSYEAHIWHHDINLLHVQNELNSGYNPDLSPYRITVACQVVEITATLQLQLIEVQTATVKYAGQAIGYGMVDACEEGIPNRARDGSIITVASSRKKAISLAVDNAVKQVVDEFFSKR